MDAASYEPNEHLMVIEAILQQAISMYMTSGIGREVHMKRTKRKGHMEGGGWGLHGVGEAAIVMAQSRNIACACLFFSSSAVFRAFAKTNHNGSGFSAMAHNTQFLLYNWFISFRFVSNDLNSITFALFSI